MEAIHVIATRATRATLTSLTDAKVATDSYLLDYTHMDHIVAAFIDIVFFC
jgi:hypothetical protein